MRIIASILILILFSAEGFACGKSYQYRLFPIGIEGNNVIAVETSLDRYWVPETEGTTKETRNRWKGTISIIRLTQAKTPELIELIDSIDILDKDYVEELKPYFRKAVQKAERINTIVLAEFSEIAFCDFKIKCNSLELKKDSLENLTLIRGGQGEINIGFPREVIIQSESSGGIKNQDFKLNSIRSIKLGGIELSVINFASGDEAVSNLKEQLASFEKHKEFESGIYKELTLYHGLAFDTIIWN